MTFNLSAGAYEAKQAGMSEDRLKKIINTFSQDVDSKIIPGFISMIVRKGKVAQFEVYGYADMENKLPLKKDSLFRIYSMTKPITGVALMVLIEDGKLRLEDPVEKFIPGFANTEVYKTIEEGVMITEPLNRPITLRDLATHTSGLSYAINKVNPVSDLYRAKNIFPYYMVDSQGVSLGTKSYKNICAFAEELSTLPLKHQPGSSWTYSVGMDVLGCVIEIASGMPFNQFLKTRIFDPLSMDDTAFMVGKDKVDRYTNLYGYMPLINRLMPGLAAAFPPGTITGLLSKREVDPYLMKPTVFDGGSGLISSTEDYMKFALMLLNKGKLGKTRILSRKSIEILSSNHLSETITQKEGYPSGKGFGITVGVTLDPAQAAEYGSKGNYYWGGAASTSFWVDNEEEMAAVFMTQVLAGPPNLGDRYRTLVYQAIDD
ncbi:MAG: serine hydrolase [SAR86 cluster bacterium]|nr:serine hydrolase [SAR86 cluster bacterium]